MRPSNNLENKIPSEKYCTVALVCTKLMFTVLYNHNWNTIRTWELQRSLLEKILAKLFALSDAKDNNSGLLNRGVTADLPFLRKLLAIWQKSEETSFCEMIKSYFIWICKFGSFKNLQGSN